MISRIYRFWRIWRILCSSVHCWLYCRLCGIGCDWLNNRCNWLNNGCWWRDWLNHRWCWLRNGNLWRYWQFRNCNRVRAIAFSFRGSSDVWINIYYIWLNNYHLCSWRRRLLHRFARHAFIPNRKNELATVHTCSFN